MTEEQKIKGLAEETQRILERLPHLKFSKYVSSSALNETAKILEQLPEIQYPVTSAGDLIEKLGGPNTKFVIEGREFFAYMAGRVPAYYFPISSAENLVEKMAELIWSQGSEHPFGRR